jgi:hypothetical protein
LATFPEFNSSILHLFPNSLLENKKGVSVMKKYLAGIVLVLAFGVVFSASASAQRCDNRGRIIIRTTIATIIARHIISKIIIALLTIEETATIIDEEIFINEIETELI